MSDTIGVKNLPKRIGERVMIRVEFRTASQGVLRVELTMRDLQVEGGHPVEKLVREGPPEWLANPSRHWDDPQDPITFKGAVKSGREAEARKALGLEEA